MDIKDIVGRQFRNLRIGAGYSQQALSEQCGIYRTYLSRIEGGTANPTIAVMAALAAALGVDTLELFREWL
jgi:transcriptional regulator with XRE-family HTH domain